MTDIKPDEKPLPVRELCFDLSRGFVITLVVMHHHRSHGPDGPSVYWYAISNYIIPVSLFVSGLTARMKPPARTFRDRFRTMMWPLLVGTLLVMPFWAFLSGNPLAYVTTQIPRILYSSGWSMIFYAAWFLPVLLLVSTIVAAFWPPAKRAVPDLRWHLPVAFLLLFAGSTLVDHAGTIPVPQALTDVLGYRPGFIKTFARLGFPWGVDIVPLGIALYWAGLVCRELRDMRRPPPGWLAAALAAGAVGFSLAFPNRFDPNSHAMGFFPVMAAGMLIKIAAVVLGSAWLAENAPRKLLAPLAKCGRYSLLILLFHTPVVWAGPLITRPAEGSWLHGPAIFLVWLAGVVLPILLNDYVFSLLPRLAKIFGAVPECDYRPAGRWSGTPGEGSAGQGQTVPA